MPRLITVFGATGAQGGSVARALLAQGKFKVRGITRSVEGKKAKELSSQGIEMVEANLDDPESCKKALAGSYGVFLVTNYWDTMDGERETIQGKAIVDVCVQIDVRHLVYSGLESAEKLYGFAVDHFDSKAKVEDYMASKAGPMKWSSVRLPMYFNNFMTNSKPIKLPDGSFIFGLPMADKPMYGMDVDDIGGIVETVFNEPENYAGKMIGLASDNLTIEQYCDVLSKVLAPRVVKDPKQTLEGFAKLGFPGAEEMVAMFKLFQKGIDRDIALTKKMNPKVKTFQEFVKKHKADFESFM